MGDVRDCLNLFRDELDAPMQRALEKLEAARDWGRFCLRSEAWVMVAVVESQSSRIGQMTGQSIKQENQEDQTLC